LPTAACNQDEDLEVEQVEQKEVAVEMKLLGSVDEAQVDSDDGEVEKAVQRVLDENGS